MRVNFGLRASLEAPGRTLGCVHPRQRQARFLAACARTTEAVAQMPLRVAVADDSYLIREALTRVLEGIDDVQIVAMCDSRDSLLAAIEAERPDVVLSDIRMPPSGDAEGIAVAVALRDAHPEIGVIMLSQYLEPGYALDLLARGSDGRAYLLKERIHDRDDLATAIRTTAAGGSVIDPKVVEVLVDARARSEASPIAALTQREREILAGVAQGQSNPAIAASLGLTKRAVEKHINAIFTKLDLPESGDVSRRVKATLMFLAEQDPTGVDAGT
jgi:DNA-binding NarL/FixJ family response regulator